MLCDLFTHLNIEPVLVMMHAGVHMCRMHVNPIVSIPVILSILTSTTMVLVLLLCE